MHEALLGEPFGEYPFALSVSDPPALEVLGRREKVRLRIIAARVCEDEVVGQIERVA